MLRGCENVILKYYVIPYEYYVIAPSTAWTKLKKKTTNIQTSWYSCFPPPSYLARPLHEPFIVKRISTFHHFVHARGNETLVIFPDSFERNVSSTPFPTSIQTCRSSSARMSFHSRKYFTLPSFSDCWFQTIFASQGYLPFLSASC